MTHFTVTKASGSKHFVMNSDNNALFRTPWRFHFKYSGLKIEIRFCL